MEYLIAAGVVGWLCRGCLDAWRMRKEISWAQVPGVIVFGGGGPVPNK